MCASLPVIPYWAKCFINSNHALTLFCEDPLVVSCGSLSPGSLAFGDKWKLGSQCVGLADLCAGITGVCFCAWITIPALGRSLHPWTPQNCLSPMSLLSWPIFCVPQAVHETGTGWWHHLEWVVVQKAEDVFFVSNWLSGSGSS